MVDVTPEVWLPIVGFEGLYEVSNLGRVKSLPRMTPRGVRGGIIRKVHADGSGYLFAELFQHSVGTKRKVHHLVLEAFVGPKPFPEAVARHLDGNRQHNAPENLAWGTPSQNMYDKRVHGTDHYANRTHCKNGHEFTPENTVPRPDSGRRCLICLRKDNAAAAARRRAKLRTEAEAA